MDLRQLTFIRRGRLLGFSLELIRELLALKDGQASASSVVHEHLRAIDRKIEDLTRWRRGLIDFLEASVTAEPDGHTLLDCFSDESTEAAAVAFLTRSLQESQRDCNDQL